MKKQIFALGLMLAATFTLTNCAKEMDSITPENEGVAFEIVASAPQVKTVNDGMKTTWKANDAINLFHAVTDGTSYVNDNSFKITADNLAAGKFTGTLTGSLDPLKEYDWYAFYPYSSHIKTPASTSSGYMPVGSKSNEKQKQTGNSNMAHIAGDNYPVAGRATAVPANSTPVIEMSHVSSLLEVKVTNKNEEALTVSSVSFAAPAGVDIVGTYYINFAGGVPTFTGSGSDYVSNIAQLEVAGGTALDKDEIATFYLAIKPFTAAANSTLTLSVNGHTKTINVTDPVEFKAGKIKTLNFGYDKQEESGEEIVENFTWDLTKASYSEASDLKVTWTSDFADMTLAKGASTTTANNYLGGTNTQTRVYKDQVLTIESCEAVTVKKVEFNVVTSYMDEFEGATWTNASTSVNGLVMTVTPVNELQPMSVKIGSATRFTSVKVYYVLGADYVAPAIVSIRAVDPQTEYYVGDEFVKPVVKALYDNDKEKDVTSSAQFTGFDSNAPVENQTITVTYEGTTTTYKVNIIAKEEGVKETKTFVVKSDDVVNNSGYQAYSKSIDGRNWVITCGGNQKSVGANKNNRSKCNLSNASYTKYAVSPLTTSSTASAFASTTKIENVSKIQYSKLSGGKNHASTKIYILYSQNGTTFSQITLTSGTQGGVINTSAGGTFEFEECSGYFAVVFAATNSSGDWRLDDVNLTFTYAE